MDTALFKLLDATIPDLNPSLADGMAVTQLKHVEEYINDVWRCAAARFPPCVKYVGYTKTTPLEEFKEASRSRNGRCIYDLSQTDMYMVKYHFEYVDQEGIVRKLDAKPMYLPFANTGGLIHIKGSLFGISPVLTDSAISVGEDSIFIALNCDKLTFRRFAHIYHANGQRETSYVVWSAIHHPPSRVSGVGRTARKEVVGKPTCAHYLFCKYGVTKTFREHGGAVVELGYEFAEDRYPRDQWVICESTGQKPIGYRNKYYPATKIKLAIRAENYNLTTSSLIASFFYVADLFPERMIPEYLEDTTHWQILLGHLYSNSVESEGKLLTKMSAHMSSLDGYVDGMVQEWLTSDGVYVEDLYELLMHVIESFPIRIITSSDSISSLYGKRLTILRYVMFDVRRAIFETLFALKKAYASKGLSATDTQSILNRLVKPTLAIKMNTKHAEVTSVSAPGDSMPLKLTCGMILQAHATGPSHPKARVEVFDAGNRLHVSLADVAGYLCPTKSAADGRGRLNPFVSFDRHGAIVRNPELKEILDKVQEEFQR